MSTESRESVTHVVANSSQAGPAQGKICASCTVMLRYYVMLMAR